MPPPQHADHRREHLHLARRAPSSPSWTPPPALPPASPSAPARSPLPSTLQPLLVAPSRPPGCPAGLNQVLRAHLPTLQPPPPLPTTSPSQVSPLLLPRPPATLPSTPPWLVVLQTPVPQSLSFPYKAQRELPEAGPSHHVPKAGHSEEHAVSPLLGARVTAGVGGWPAHA